MGHYVNHPTRWSPCGRRTFRRSRFRRCGRCDAVGRSAARRRRRPRKSQLRAPAACGWPSRGDTRWPWYQQVPARGVSGTSPGIGSARAGRDPAAAGARTTTVPSSAVVVRVDQPVEEVCNACDVLRRAVLVPRLSAAAGDREHHQAGRLAVNASPSSASVTAASAGDWCSATNAASFAWTGSQPPSRWDPQLRRLHVLPVCHLRRLVRDSRLVVLSQ